MTTLLKIQPRPAIRGGLLSVAQSLEAVLPAGSNWRLGVEMRESPDDGLFTWHACDDSGQAIAGGDISEKIIAAVGDSKVFFPQFVEKIVQCGPGAQHTAIGDIARETADGTIERTYGAVLAATMHGLLQTVGDNGVVGDSLKTIASYPSDFVVKSPTSIQDTLRMLLEQVCDCFNTDPVFHIPRQFMPYFLTNNLVTWDGTNFHLGPHLVSFDCYPNVNPDPDAETSDPTADDGSEVWIFTTTEPLTATDDRPDELVLTRELNNYKAMAERATIIAFDPTCAGAAKASVV